MPIEDGDYLGWYTKEISRYRNHEWKLTSYSVAFSLTIVLFARRGETKDLIESWLAALAIMVLMILIMLAQFHTHSRLNEYRERLSRLLSQGEHHDNNIQAPLYISKFDAAYFIGFVSVTGFFGIGAAWVLYNS